MDGVWFEAGHYLKQFFGTGITALIKPYLTNVHLCLFPVCPSILPDVVTSVCRRCVGRVGVEWGGNSEIWVECFG